MSIKDRKERERQARINQIKKIARVMFQKKGLGDTKMEEIAEEAEISKPTIYKYFKSKNDLFYEIMREPLTKLNRDVIEISARREGPERTIALLVEKTFSFYMEYPEIHYLVTELKKSDIKKHLSTEKARHLKEVMATNLKQLEMAIKDGIEEGMFEKIEPKLAAIIIWNMYMGIIKYQENRLDVGKNDYRKSTVDAGVALMLHGLRRR